MLSYMKPRSFKHISRYSRYRQISSTLENATYLESPDEINANSKDCLYHIVDASEENRLDIISNIYYRTPHLYWYIAMANNLLDPMIIVKGTVLKIPNYNSIFNTDGPLYRKG